MRACPYHDWNEKSFPWAALDRAGGFIESLVRWCRLGIHWKEKYGTLRVEPWFFNGTLHSLIYPGYVYRRFPKWLWKFDIVVIAKLLGIFVKPVQRVQVYALKRAYKMAILVYPDLKEEILADYPLDDYDEFLTECGWVDNGGELTDE